VAGCATLSGRSCHAPTFLGTSLAGHGTLAAVRRFVLLAFSTTLLTDLGAQGAKLNGTLAAARHECGRKAADCCAVDIELDAPRHHFHLVFAQTRGGTLIAGVGAFVARLDTGAEFFNGHGTSSGCCWQCVVSAVLWQIGGYDVFDRSKWLPVNQTAPLLRFPKTGHYRCRVFEIPERASGFTLLTFEVITSRPCMWCSSRRL
jgi:hypothetical protein